jgi:hypothetical protein
MSISKTQLGARKFIVELTDSGPPERIKPDGLNALILSSDESYGKISQYT